MRGVDAQALQSVFDVRGVLEGLAARSAVGAPSLPAGIAVEVEAIVAVA